MLLKLRDDIMEWLVEAMRVRVGHAGFHFNSWLKQRHKACSHQCSLESDVSCRWHGGRARRIACLKTASQRFTLLIPRSSVRALTATYVWCKVIGIGILQDSEYISNDYQPGLGLFNSSGLPICVSLANFFSSRREFCTILFVLRCSKENFKFYHCHIFFVVIAALKYARQGHYIVTSCYFFPFTLFCFCQLQTPKWTQPNYARTPHVGKWTRFASSHPKFGGFPPEISGPKLPIFDSFLTTLQLNREYLRNDAWQINRKTALKTASSYIIPQFHKLVNFRLQTAKMTYISPTLREFAIFTVRTAYGGAI